MRGVHSDINLRHDMNESSRVMVHVLGVVTDNEGETKLGNPFFALSASTLGSV